jgi:hypothetical protein
MAYAPVSQYVRSTRVRGKVARQKKRAPAPVARSIYVKRK